MYNTGGLRGGSSTTARVLTEGPSLWESTPSSQQRLGTDEFYELQQCRHIIENLQERVQDLERINLDLEYRLEDQAKQCMSVEKECIEIERTWKAKCESLETEICHWKDEYESQKLKGDRLREHLSRTERELYGILQRKYELIRGPGGRIVGPAPGGGPGGSGSGGSSRDSNSWDSRTDSLGGSGNGKSLNRQSTERDDFFSELLVTPQVRGAPKETRQRRMVSTLKEFLGL